MSHPASLSHVACPYTVLLNCFKQEDSSYYQTALLAYQQQVQATKVCTNLAVSTLVKDVQQLQALFRAVYQIYCHPKEYQETLAQYPKLDLKKVDTLGNSPLVYLSKKEGKNPYLVFQQLFLSFTLEEVNEAFFDLVGSH